MAWAVTRSGSQPPGAEAALGYGSCTVGRLARRSPADSLIFSAYIPMSGSSSSAAIFFSAVIWSRIVLATELRWLTSSVTRSGLPGVGSSSRPSGRQATPVGRPIGYLPCLSSSPLLRVLAENHLRGLLVGLHE